LTLYLVIAANEDEENLDLLVEAGSADAAAQMLVDHWAADEVEVAGDVIVYEIPTSARPGVVDWARLRCSSPPVVMPDTSDWWQ
jgi:hypothetical protein